MTRGSYDMVGFIQQFKSHVLCFLEKPAVAIYHAAQSYFESLNAMQRNFVQKLGLSEAEASLVHKMAPLALRTDITALGLLEKIQLGEAHPDFSGLFPQRIGAAPDRTRHGSRIHGRQLWEIPGYSYYVTNPCSTLRHRTMYCRNAVAGSSMSAFQAAFTKDASIAYQTGRADWITMCNRHYASLR